MGNLDFLKPVLGDELYEQVEAKLKDNKDVNLANLASGEYVSKAKYDDAIKERDEQIDKLNKTVQSYDGANVEDLKKQIKDWEDKYNTDLQQTKLDDAIKLAVMQAGPIEAKALMPYLDTSIVKFDKDGNLVGLSEQLEKAKKEHSFLFPQSENKGTEGKANAQVNLGGKHSEPANTDGADLRTAFGLKQSK